MKKIILSLSVIVFGIVTYAQQSLILFRNDIELTNDDVVQIDSIQVVGGYNEVIAYVQVKNTTRQEISVKVRRTIIDSVPGCQNQICWGGLCFSPDVWNSPTSEALAAGAISGPESFSGHYLPNDHPGTSIIRYTFYDESNPNDTASVIVQYTVGFLSIGDLLSASSISSPYPNPASSKVSIDYQLPAQVKIADVKLYNIVGQEVKSELLTGISGKLQLQLTNLNEGVYFMTIFLNGQAVKTNRIIISR